MSCKYEGLLNKLNVRTRREVIARTFPVTSFYSWETKNAENWLALDHKASLGVDLRLDSRSYDFESIILSIA